MPGPLSLLRATTTEEQVIVNLVIGRCTVPIEYSWRCSLEADHNSRVILVSPNMSTQPVSLPTKICTTIERLPDVEPIGSIFFLNIGVGSHVSQAENSAFIGYVWRGNLINSPG
jgi:hypothetical protein